MNRDFYQVYNSDHDVVTNADTVGGLINKLATLDDSMRDLWAQTLVFDSEWNVVSSQSQRCDLFLAEKGIHIGDWQKPEDNSDH